VSFIDTIALPLFIAIVGLVVLIAIGAWGWAMVSEARAKKLAAKRNLKLEQQAYELLHKLYVESNLTTGGATLSPELSDELFTVIDRIDTTKGLNR
jgi:hypothetical protein